ASSRDGFRLHRHDALRKRQELECFRDAPRRLGLAERCQKLADLAQGFRITPLDTPHGNAHGNPLHRAKEIGEHWNVGPLTFRFYRMLEKYRGTFLCKEPGLDFGHFKDRRDRLLDAHKLALGFKARDEIAKGAIRHGADFTVLSISMVRRGGSRS